MKMVEKCTLPICLMKIGVCQMQRQLSSQKLRAMKVLSLRFCGRKVLVQDEPHQLHSRRGRATVRGDVYQRGANNRSQGIRICGGSHIASKQPAKQKLHNEKDQSSSDDGRSEPEKKIYNQKSWIQSLKRRTKPIK